MMQPQARVVKIEYRDQQPKMAADTSAFVVHYRAPDGEIYEHPLENSDWTLDNPTLQFMAKHNFKPYDVDSTSMNVEHWQWLVPVILDSDGTFLLAQNALNGGRAALESAEWFASNDDEESSDEPHSGPHGGGGDGGDKGGGMVDHESDDEVTIEVETTPNQDSGVNVEVS